MCILRIKDLSPDAIRERRLVESVFGLLKDKDQQVLDHKPTLAMIATRTLTYHMRRLWRMRSMIKKP